MAQSVRAAGRLVSVDITGIVKVGVEVGLAGCVVSADVQDAGNNAMLKMIGIILLNVMFMEFDLCENVQDLLISLSDE